MYNRAGSATRCPAFWTLALRYSKTWHESCYAVEASVELMHLYEISSFSAFSFSRELHVETAFSI